jgi:protein-S-isoprenylcysteine O-methyltransferase Ste14
MFDSIFEVFWLIGIIAGSIIRAVFTARARHWWRNNQMATHGYMTGLDKLLTLLNSLGLFIIPFVYVLTSWLDFANYHILSWCGWIGCLIFVAALWLLWRSHADLGINFSPQVQLKNDHTLIMTGVFQYIRHPMYSAHVLWASAQILLLQNWIAGFSMLVFQVLLYVYRIPREEKMMLDTFGEDYRSYMERTGRFIPHFK